MGQLLYHYEKFFVDPVSYGQISLLQLGTSHCKSGAVISEHAHWDYFELTVVTSGEGIVETNGISVPVKRDDIYVSFPLDRHRISVPDNTTMHYDFFAFFVHDTELFGELQNIILQYGDPTKRVIKNGQLKQLVSSAIYEMSEDKMLKSAYLETLFRQIVIQIIRSFSNQSSTAAVPVNKDELCYQIMGYITANIYSIRSLQQITEELKYDYTYLSKVFKKNTSQTISDYYNLRRLETACTLIRETDLSFTQIAAKLNYSSVYSFSKAFKKHYRIAPMDYRKSVLAERS
ncbi:MAG: AraC family transcriptional regulator [Clostridia bacterium]|nr:AraC family transcriptional regulator [Clostridia bacterium]